MPSRLPGKQDNTRPHFAHAKTEYNNNNNSLQRFSQHSKCFIEGRISSTTTNVAIVRQNAHHTPESVF